MFPNPPRYLPQVLAFNPEIRKLTILKIVHMELQAIIPLRSKQKHRRKLSLSRKSETTLHLLWQPFSLGLQVHSGQMQVRHYALRLPKIFSVELQMAKSLHMSQPTIGIRTVIQFQILVASAKSIKLSTTSKVVMVALPFPSIIR